MQHAYQPLPLALDNIIKCIPPLIMHRHERLDRLLDSRIQHQPIEALGVPLDLLEFIHIKLQEHLLRKRVPPNRRICQHNIFIIQLLILAFMLISMLAFIILIPCKIWDRRRAAPPPLAPPAILLPRLPDRRHTEGITRIHAMECLRINHHSAVHTQLGIPVMRSLERNRVVRHELGLGVCVFLKLTATRQKLLAHLVRVFEEIEGHEGHIRYLQRALIGRDVQLPVAQADPLPVEIDVLHARDKAGFAPIPA